MGSDQMQMLQSLQQIGQKQKEEQNKMLTDSADSASGFVSPSTCGSTFRSPFSYTRG